MADALTLEQSLEHQASSCRIVGSEIYASLLRGVLADYRAGGVTAELLDGLSDRPLNDAIALRYLAVGHRLALSGRAPDLAAHYPSCGGTWDGEDLTPLFLATVEAHRPEFERGVRDGVQTNEVGRAAVLASGFAEIARRHGLPLDVLEIGSSAGLLSRWDSFWYDTGETQLGDPDSPLRFGPEWWIEQRPRLDGDVRVVRRRGSDIAPIDVASEEGRLTMLSFVWPDQIERVARLQAAADVAARVPFRVEQADAGEWLGEQLRDGPAPGATTVVFHSIVWQYLPRATRDTLRAALRSAGERADASSPVAWLRMEPATPEHADLRLTTWPGGEEEVLAHVGYHGAGVRWLADR